jgi:hypothetical protein
MEVVLKLTNGEEIMCRVENADVLAQEYFNIDSPMNIVSQSYDQNSLGTRLRDTLILGDGNSMCINQKHIISYYLPNKHLVQYYDKAIKYSNEYQKPFIEKQISAAVKDIDLAMKEEDEASKDLTELLMRLAGQTLQ